MRRRGGQSVTSWPAPPPWNAHTLRACILLREQQRLFRAPPALQKLPHYTARKIHGEKHICASWASYQDPEPSFIHAAPVFRSPASALTSPSSATFAGATRAGMGRWVIWPDYYVSLYLHSLAFRSACGSGTRFERSRPSETKREERERAQRAIE